MSTFEPPASPPDRDPDDLLATVAAALAALPAPALDDLSAERIRHAARAALDEEVARAHQPTRRALTRLWSRAVMPALVAATVCVYLGWAVRAAAALYR